MVVRRVLATLFGGSIAAPYAGQLVIPPCSTAPPQQTCSSYQCPAGYAVKPGVIPCGSQGVPPCYTQTCCTVAPPTLTTTPTLMSTVTYTPMSTMSTTLTTTPAPTCSTITCPTGYRVNPMTSCSGSCSPTTCCRILPSTVTTTPAVTVTTTPAVTVTSTPGQTTTSTPAFPMLPALTATTTPTVSLANPYAPISRLYASEDTPELQASMAAPATTTSPWTLGFLSLCGMAGCIALVSINHSNRITDKSTRSFRSG